MALIFEWDGHMFVFAKNLGALGAFILCAAFALATPAGAAEPQIDITVGAESLFVDADRFGCAGPGTFDAPDIPMRAFRDQAGLVHALLVNHENYEFVGATLSAVARPDSDACRRILAPPPDPSDPTAFRNFEWVMSAYTLNGNNVYAVVHNEFRGGLFPQFKSECPDDVVGSHCFYSSITLAVSNDGGSTFTPAQPFVIAAPLEPFSPAVKHTGPYAQTNIVRSPNDGKFYVLMGFARDAEGGAVQQPGICVMQSENLKDWRFWNGKAFDVEIGSPYVQGRPPASRICQVVLGAGVVLRSIVYQSSSHLFIAVGTQARRPVYWTSTDLLAWSAPAPLADNQLGDAEYLSIVDPNSRSRNFDTIENTPTLYVIRAQRRNGRVVRGKREVVSFPLKITRH